MIRPYTYYSRLIDGRKRERERLLNRSRKSESTPFAAVAETLSDRTLMTAAQSFATDTHSRELHSRQRRLAGRDTPESIQANLGI